jgi:GDP-4-dehydro-6-deoxy-D-mannose reductase
LPGVGGRLQRGVRRDLPDDLPVDEDTPLRPTSPYAVSKVTQDLLGLQYWLSQRVEAVRVRPFNSHRPAAASRLCGA